MALQLEEDAACPGCGHPRDESMSPDAEGKYRVRKIGCHACAERAKTEDDMREDRSEPGIHLVVERIT